MAATLFDQWVGRAPSAKTLEARGTNRTHLSDRASAVPQVSTVLGGGEAATYYDAEKRTRAFLAENGVATDRYGFPTDEEPHDDHKQPTNIMMARGVMSAIYDDTPAQTSIDLANHDEGFIIGGTTGSSVDASDPAAMDWPTLMYAVSHDEQHLPCATQKAAPIYVYYVPFAITANGTVYLDIDAERTLIRVDQQRVSKIGRVNHGRPRNYHKDKPASSTERAQATANPQITCVDCKRRTRKRHESITDKVCLPCGNERLTVETKTHILTDG